MDWAQFATLILTFTGLFFWSRSESRSDCRRLEDMVISIHKEIHQEMKDFHGRLCKIEEGKK